MANYLYYKTVITLFNLNQLYNRNPNTQHYSERIEKIQKKLLRCVFKVTVTKRRDYLNINFIYKLRNIRFIYLTYCRIYIFKIPNTIFRTKEINIFKIHN